MKPRKLPLFVPAIVITASAFLSSVSDLQAAKTWAGTTDANWATTTNWVELALPGTTETVNFNDLSTANLGAINLGENRTIRGISFTNPAGPVTLLNNTLTIGSGGINVNAATQDLTISCPNIVIQTGAFQWNPPAGRTLTLSSVPHRNSPVTYGGGNNDNVGGTVQVSTIGTTRLTTASLALVTDSVNSSGGGGNPFMSYGASDWAATDATGKVIAATYANSSAGVYNGVNLNIDSDPTVATVTPNSIRFADTVTPHTITISGTNTVTGRGILMAPGTLTSTIAGGNLRPNRSSTAGCTFTFMQNSTAGDLVIGAGMGNASSGAPVSFAKSGVGKVIFTNTCGNSGRVFINEGTIQYGNGGAGGAPGTPASIVNNGALAFNRSDTLGVITNISGTGGLSQIGTGEITLTTSVSTFTGPVNINAGTLAVTTMANLGAGTAINIDGGTFKFLGGIDPSARTVTIGSSGATFNTNGQNITFAAAVGNAGTGSLTKSGIGSLTLTQPAGWTGNTVIDGGTLLANNTTGSATSGSVTINATGSLGGTGIVSGAVSATGDSTITPGNGGVGTLTVGSLDLQSGAVLNLEFGTGNDRVNVSDTGGLAINGGTVNLYQDGTNLATPFAGTPGTYNLFQYSGTLGGAATNLTIGNPQPGKGYVFGTSGGFVTVTIADTGVVRNWITNGGGSWATAGNWSGTVPNGAQAVANFNTALSGPATVTLDGNKTVGSLTFTSAANGYTIAQGTGGSLTFSNTGNSSIVDNAGNHSVSAPVVLSSNLDVSVPLAVDSLSISGDISGARSITKTGLGAFNLTGNNTFSAGLNLTGGSTTFGPSGLGTGAVSLDDTRLIWDSGNTADITSGGRLVSLLANTVTFDTNSNDVVLSSNIGEGGSAALVKAGLGKLTLAGELTSYGEVTISGGALQIGNGGATGSIPLIFSVVNNGELIVNRADEITLSSGISGTGTLTKNGANNLILSGINTFTGETFLNAGTLTIASGGALQNSSLHYTQGDLIFDATVTATTIGSLTGTKSLALDNTALAAVTLTVGGNNASGGYSGVLSGTGGLTKAGTGTLSLDNVHTYTGATGINGGGGTLELLAGGSITTTALNTGTGGTRFLVSGGSFTSSAMSTIDARGYTAISGFNLLDGSAAFNGGVRTTANDGTLISVEGGTFTASEITLPRTRNYNGYPQGPSSSNLEYIEVDAGMVDGFVVTGGTANVSGALIIGTSNSGSSAMITGGKTTVAGVVTIGDTTNTRWSLLQIAGGEFTSTEAVSGILLSPNIAHANKAMIKLTGGVSTVEKVTFGTATSIAGAMGNVWIKAGELYVGSGGLVQDGLAGSFTSTIQLTGGTLGAKADWTTTLPVTLDGFATIKAADALGVSRNITIGGALSGIGSISKTGAGTLTLNGANTYTGNTDVLEGTLVLSTDDVLSDTALLNIDTGATLNLTHAGIDTVGQFLIDGVAVTGSGTFGGTGSGADHIVPQITGTGKIYVAPTDPYIPWASGYGLTGNDSLATSDFDKDGLVNLMEFILGGDPTVSSQSVLPTQTLNSTQLIMTFKRSDASESPVTAQTVEVTNNLASWNAVISPIVIGATSSSGAGYSVTITENGAAADDVVVAIDRAANVKLFGRVKAVK